MLFQILRILRQNLMVPLVTRASLLDLFPSDFLLHRPRRLGPGARGRVAVGHEVVIAEYVASGGGKSTTRPAEPPLLAPAEACPLSPRTLSL